ncbi:MAG: hypothetical protein KFB93_01600 [Simkaniaceae bacterium]|nr:MAG: hypothetical protein KFB93_01600 [Simkaniaceae bacterium]
MNQGVMTGCNQSQEHYLKHWFENYSKHNNYPVTFCDFGMSEKARTFCIQNGTLLKAPSKAFALPKSPYENTIWTDINCEIKQTLIPLFEMTSVKDGFAISYSKEQAPKSGVIAFKQNSPVILNWQAWCIKNKNATDESTLDLLLKENAFQITEFSEKYLWTGPLKAPPNTVIHLAC